MSAYDQAQQASAQQTNSKSGIPDLGGTAVRAQSAELHQYSGSTLATAQTGVKGAGVVLNPSIHGFSLLLSSTNVRSFGPGLSQNFRQLRRFCSTRSMHWRHKYVAN